MYAITEMEIFFETFAFTASLNYSWLRMAIRGNCYPIDGQSSTRNKKLRLETMFTINFSSTEHDQETVTPQKHL